MVFGRINCKLTLNSRDRTCIFCLHSLLIGVGIIFALFGIMMLVVAKWGYLEKSKISDMKIGAVFLSISMIQLFVGCCSVCCYVNTAGVSESDVITSDQQTNTSTFVNIQEENRVIFMIT